jgi:hypothetical protein
MTRLTPSSPMPGGEHPEREEMLAFPSAASVAALASPTSSPWITAYDEAVLAAKDAATRDAYRRILRQFANFVATLPGMQVERQLVPAQLTRTVVESYLAALQEAGYSASHR